MSAIYYIDGSTLLNSVSIYTDKNLTICAADGFYSDGENVRELVNCVLQDPVPCGLCGNPCGDTVNASGGAGIYLLNLNTGTTVEDTGVIVVRFDPAALPDGVRATFGGVVYNELSSPVDGYHASTDPNGFTVIGDDTYLAGEVGTHLLTEYEYDGSAFVATGNTQNITIAAGDISLSSGVMPDYCVMVIPKPSASPAEVSLEFVGVQAGTGWYLQTICPYTINPIAGTIVHSNEVDAEADNTYGTSYYPVGVNGYVKPEGQIVLGLYDWIFTDQGSTKIADGWFKRDDGYLYQVQNGVIIQIIGA